MSSIRQIIHVLRQATDLLEVVDEFVETDDPEARASLVVDIHDGIQALAQHDQTIIGELLDTGRSILLQFPGFTVASKPSS